MSRPTYSRVPDTDATGSTSHHSLSRRESESNLVPRTPHSRSGGQTFVPPEHGGPGSHDDSEESYELTQQSQTAPLLASSTSATFGDRLTDAEARIRAPAIRRAHALSRIPLVIGGAFSVLLCLLIFVSINWPDTLQSMLQTSEPEVLDKTPTSGAAPAEENGSASNHTGAMAHNHTTLIDYSAYTAFPLTPEQYRAECWKQQANHFHGGYWAKPPGEHIVLSSCLFD